jgi:hypothetical protein
MPVTDSSPLESKALSAAFDAQQSRCEPPFEGTFSTKSPGAVPPIHTRPLVYHLRIAVGSGPFRANADLNRSGPDDGYFRSRCLGPLMYTLNFNTIQGDASNFP